MAARYLHLHIGRQKTGTTSFQVFLDKNHQRLLQRDIALFESDISLDPETMNPRSWAHELPLTLLRPDFSFALRMLTREKDLTSEELLATIRRNLCKPAQHLIASHEALSYARSAEELKPLRNMAEETNREVKVYLVLRSHEAWLRSYRNQFASVAESNPNADSFFYLEPDSWLFDHDALIATYEKAFGCGAVQVLDYERLLQDFTDASPALLSRMNLGVQTSMLEKVPWQNVSNDKVNPVKIAIVGPGRSGTSLLVQLLQGWGFSVPESTWFEVPNAGGEMRLNPDSTWEVQKDPWAYQYLEKLDMRKFSHVIIPIRDLGEAASSRVAQELYARMQHTEGDDWNADSIGYTAGGIIADVTTSSVSNILSRGLWELLLKLSEQGVQPIFLHFPRFAEDFTYVERVLSPIWDTKISRDQARTVWERVCSSAKIRASHGSSQVSDRERELLTLIKVMKSQIESQKTGEIDSHGQLRELIELKLDQMKKIDDLNDENRTLRKSLEALYFSKTWRWSKPVRALLDRLQI